MEYHPRRIFTGLNTGSSTRERRHITTNPGDDSTFLESDDLESDDLESDDLNRLDNNYIISNSIFDTNDVNVVLLIIFITYLFNKK